MCKNEEEQEEIIKPSLFVYTLEYIRPCAGGERAIAVYSRNKNVVCEQWYEYTTHTHIHDSKCKREKERRRNKLGVDEKRREQDAPSITEKKEKEIEEKLTTSRLIPIHSITVLLRSSVSSKHLPNQKEKYQGNYPFNQLCAYIKRIL
jgi:hypothetical protein